jgi:galactitol-specific phosphotransferase system IIC component
MVIGTKCPLPDLFASPVVLTLVAEDQRGRVVDGVFFEAVIDCTKLSARPGGFRSLTGIAAELGAFFKSRSFRRTLAAMPPRISDKMEDGLKRAGFFRETLHLWSKWL